MRVDGYIEEVYKDKYMVFDSTDENKELIDLNDDWLEYWNGYKKNSDNNLPLNKPLKFINMTVTIRCVFSEDNKLYSQAFLDGALFSL